MKSITDKNKNLELTNSQFQAMLETRNSISKAVTGRKSKSAKKAARMSSSADRQRPNLKLNFDSAELKTFNPSKPIGQLKTMGSSHFKADPNSNLNLVDCATNSWETQAWSFF